MAYTTGNRNGGDNTGWLYTPAFTERKLSAVMVAVATLSADVRRGVLLGADLESLASTASDLKIIVRPVGYNLNAGNNTGWVIAERNGLIVAAALVGRSALLASIKIEKTMAGNLASRSRVTARFGTALVTGKALFFGSNF